MREVIKRLEGSWKGSWKLQASGLLSFLPECFYGLEKDDVTRPRTFAWSPDWCNLGYITGTAFDSSINLARQIVY